MVRGGYGIFYDTSCFNEDIFSVINAPWSKSYTATGTLANPINFDGLFPQAPTPAPVAGAISSLSLNSGNRTPYMEQWNIDVERELATDWVLDVGYQGAGSTRLDDRNVPTQGQLMSNGTVVDSLPQLQFYSPHGKRWTIQLQRPDHAHRETLQPRILFRRPLHLEQRPWV